MIKETGTVIAVESGLAWVEAQRRPACGHCGEGPACATSVLARLHTRRPSTVCVHDTLGVVVGDAVVVGKHSGTRALSSALGGLGLELEPERAPKLLARLRGFVRHSKRPPTERDLRSLHRDVTGDAEGGGCE